MGVVSPNGVGREAYAAALREGRSGITAIEGLDTNGLRSSALGQVRDFDLTIDMDASEVRRVPRMVPLALRASHEAIAQAGLDEWINSGADVIERQRQVGVALGTGGGGLAFVEEQYRLHFTQHTASLYSIVGGTHGNLSSELSIALGLRG
ncbi:MAG: 3-oxoacyl-(acyl-carrier-protein) synthase, partial [Phycisphaerales bacterium]|nr:3-oxoacyl-(acyl-carrier-protein) synthase [Phycisphaerales bacterium]